MTSRILTQDVFRILEFKSNPKNMDEREPYESLFKTKCGKRFGDQTEGLANFVVKGQMLSIILPLTSSISSFVVQGLKKGDFDTIAPSLPIEEKHQLEASKKMMKDVETPRSDEVEDIVYSKNDILWFLSLVTFSLHTYLDVYTMCVIEQVAKHRVMKEKIDSYLAELSPPLFDISGAEIRHANELKRAGVLSRLVALEEGLRLVSLLEQVMDYSQLLTIRDACRTFNRMRGKIAHADPQLKQEQYTFEEFEKDLDEPVLEFEDVKRAAALPKSIEDVMTLIKPGIKELSDVVRKTILIIRMALTYPALIDVTLDAVASEESGQ